MFSFDPTPTPTPAPAAIAVPPKHRISPKGLYPQQSAPIHEVTLNAIDGILDLERNHNKTESWNKLDKTIKLQKLDAFAETYSKEHRIPLPALKRFFVECLEKNKLQKTKEVLYDKDRRAITSIPGLHVSAGHHFTLKNLDAKRVSTLKSLTPKEFSKTASFTTRRSEGADPEDEVTL